MRINEGLKSYEMTSQGVLIGWGESALNASHTAVLKVEFNRGPAALCHLLLLYNHSLSSLLPGHGTATTTRAADRQLKEKSCTYKPGLAGYQWPAYSSGAPPRTCCSPVAANHWNRQTQLRTWRGQERMWNLKFSFLNVTSSISSCSLDFNSD